MNNNRFDAMFAEADKAFDGKYRSELSGLMGLSQSEIDALTPDTTDVSTYAKLIKIVEVASQENMNQAELISNIKSLGDLAVKIAKKVPKLAALF